MVLLSVPYYYLYEDKFSIARVDEITSEQFWDVLNMYLIANIAFIVGFLIYHKVSTHRIREVYNLDLNNALFTKYKIPSYFSKIAYILTFIVIICYLATYGELLLQRYEYIPKFDKKFLITIAKVLSLVSSIILGLIYSYNKPLSVVLIITTLIFTLGTGSRISFLILMLYFLTIFQMTGNTRTNKLRFLFQIILSFVFLSYLISLRQLNEHGIIPYASAIFVGDSQILESIAFNIYYSFIFGVFATARTLSESDPNWYYIYVSINPLPGSMVGWPEVAKELMITRFMPYTLHGQVFKMGYTFLIVFFFILGVIFSFFEKVIRKYLIREKKRTAVLFALILALFVFYSFEYHLRSALRYIYYAYFILLVIWFLKKAWKLLPKKAVE
jgi:hypothetical protein